MSDVVSESGLMEPSESAGNLATLLLFEPAARRTGRPAIVLPPCEIAAYVGGESSVAIASRVGCSGHTVRAALRRAGVTVRPSGPISRKPPKQPRVKLSPEEHFWAHVERVEGGCWPWHGATARGYGTFTSRKLGGTFRANRLAYTFARGPIPDGLHVLHECDNPPCCNPAHLFLGTHLDNVRDMVAKGRGAKGESHGSRLHPERMLRGEEHPHAKLTDAQVAEIRATPRRRGVQRVLARRFNVSEATVSMIVNGKVWNAAGTGVAA